MKKLTRVFGIGVLALAGVFTIAADHIDAPSVQGGSSDITDFYAFQGANTDNMVFVANMQGLLSPESTGDAMFDESVMVEFNIDNNGDYIEDFVIQAVPKNGKMYVFGPMTPGQTGLSSTLYVKASENPLAVDITPYGNNAITASANGVSVFAGPRDDPFFMDFAQYTQIIGGNATSFNNPGVDTFAGTNVMSIVVEVPKSMIGGTGTINTWVESKRKQ